MIKCPKCGADNMIGAIFCRGCSEKLNIDDLTPDDIAKATTEKKEGGGGARNLVALFFFFAIVGVITAIVYPPEYTKHDSLDADLTKAGRQKVGHLMSPKTPVDEKIEFTLAEVVSIGREELGMTPEAISKSKEDAAETGTSMYLVQQEFDMELLPNNQVRLILKSQLMEFTDLYTTMICDVKVDNGKLAFVPVSAHMGRLPLFFEIFINSAEQRFSVLAESNKDLLEVRDEIASVQIDVGRSMVILTRKAPEKKPADKK